MFAVVFVFVFVVFRTTLAVRSIRWPTHGAVITVAVVATIVDSNFAQMGINIVLVSISYKFGSRSISLLTVDAVWCEEALSFTFTHSALLSLSPTTPTPREE